MEDPGLFAGVQSAAVAVTPQLAEENLLAMRRMFAELASAAEARGITVSDVAESLGTDVDTAAAALSGAVDLTLSDLQELAFSVDACLSYRVVPHFTAHSDRIAELVRTLDTDSLCEKAAPDPFDASGRG